MAKWQDFAGDLDDETKRVVAIGVDVLVVVFGCERMEAESLMATLFEKHSDRYDEDHIHRESSYYLAAAAYFVGREGGEINSFIPWLNQTGRLKAPEVALKMFREKYFD